MLKEQLEVECYRQLGFMPDQLEALGFQIHPCKCDRPDCPGFHIGLTSGGETVVGVLTNQVVLIALARGAEEERKRLRWRSVALTFFVWLNIALCAYLTWIAWR